MTDSLRLIAVHVEEPDAGRYEWVLTERGDGDSWAELERSRSSVPAYQEAMRDGLLALQLLVGDLDKGPRQAEESQVEQHDPHEPKQLRGETGSTRKTAFFGFGPAR